MSKLKLRGYQERIVARACKHDYFAFAMEMGTGKTVCVIDMARRRNFKSVLVVCPSSLKNNWVAELAKCASQPYEVYVLNSTDKGRKGLLKNQWTEGKQRWVIVGVESLGSSKNNANTVLSYMKENPSAMVIDESHFIKTPKSIRTKVCMTLGNFATSKYILSGTITTGYINDLYTQYTFLHKDSTGHKSYYAFINQYCVLKEITTQAGFPIKIVVGSKNREELLKRFEGFTESVRIVDVVDELPNKSYKTIVLSMPPYVRAAYDSVPDWQGDLTGLIKMAQISGGFDETEDNEKFLIQGGQKKAEEARDLVNSTTGQVVIWARFRAEMVYLNKILNQETYNQARMLWGDTPIEDRQALVDDFQAGKFKVLIANPSVGGTGFNLTAAHLAIFYSNSFTYSDRAQAEARLHRLGQKNHVTIVDLVYEDSIDEKILDALARKEDLLTYIKQVFNYAEPVRL